LDKQSEHRGQPAKRTAAASSGKRARGRPSNHAAKREEIIAGATGLFNERGIAGVSLTDVANLADIARASIYHYVKDRNELVFQCYSRACDLAADDLAAASKAKTGFARTIDYVRRSLTPDRAPVAVLTEVNSLDPEIANLIRRANTANTNHLISFISQGVKDGSMRPCDADVVAQAVNGMLAWLQLLAEWSEGYSDAKGRARVADSLVELLTHGLAVNRKKPFQCTLRAQQFAPQIDDIFDRRQSSALKLERVLAAASRLFTRNGIEATSIDEIAGELGVTKGVLYHYLKDKADLITQCYQRSFDLYDRFVDAAISSGGDGLEAALINAHLNTQAQAGALSPLLPQPGFGALAGPIRRKLHKRAADQNHTLANLLKQGMEEGVVRPCATGLVTHMCAGAIGWIPKWLASDSLYTPAEMGDKICDLFRLGLRA
jgi:AcrR family transcriptional regulator